MPAELRYAPTDDGIDHRWEEALFKDVIGPFEHDEFFGLMSLGEGVVGILEATDYARSQVA